MSLWVSEFSPPNPPLNDQLVTAAQSQLKVRLPASYLELLAAQNGGYIDEQLVAVSPSSIPDALRQYISDGYVSIDSIAGISDSDSVDSICHTPYFLSEWSLPVGLVLLHGDGHSWIALDYRTAAEDPPVVLIESDGGMHLQLAANFEEFVASFVRYESVYDEDGELISKC